MVSTPPERVERSLPSDVDVRGGWFIRLARVSAVREARGFGVDRNLLSAVGSDSRKTFSLWCGLEKVSWSGS